MRILTDQNIYKPTIVKLKEWGHNIITTKELGMERASDEEILIQVHKTSCQHVPLLPY